MWTKENRAKYNRDHLRYPSDLTDDEWALVEPFIPPAKSGGGKRQTDMRGHEWGYVYSEHWLPMALPSDIFRRAAQSITTSFGGSATACWIAFIAHSAWNAARRRNETPAPPPASSIVRA